MGVLHIFDYTKESLHPDKKFFNNESPISRDFSYLGRVLSNRAKSEFSASGIFFKITISVRDDENTVDIIVYENDSNERCFSVVTSLSIMHKYRRYCILNQDKEVDMEKLIPSAAYYVIKSLNGFGYEPDTIEIKYCYSENVASEVILR